MRNKTNPFEKIRIEIEEMIRNKKYSKIEEEIQKVLSSYSKENNEIIDVAINNFLLQVINNYKDTEFDVKVLGNVTSVYLDFIDNKDSDLNTAVFFLRLASHFNDKKEKSIAKNCLLKSKEIYNRLGLSKDVAKVDRILSKFVEIKTVVKKVKTVKKSKAKTKKKKKKKTKKKAKKP